MQLILARIPPVESIYPAGKEPKTLIGENDLGLRIGWGHPDLVSALTSLEGAGIHLRYSDVFRTAASSKARRADFQARIDAYDEDLKKDPTLSQRKKRPRQLAKRPGESPHSFGLSVDIDTAHALKKYGWTKPQMDQVLRQHGLECHLRDGSQGDEEWHYNALGRGVEKARWLSFASTRSTSRAVEAKLQSIYGAQMILTPEQSASALAYLGYKDVRSFQSAWDLDVDGKAGPKTNRLLAYLEAEKRFFATTKV